MTATAGLTKRDVIPRWRSVRRTLGTGELVLQNATALALTEDDINLLNERRYEWEAEQTVSFASDFVGTALLLGVPQDAQDAITFLGKVDAGKPISTLARAAAACDEVTAKESPVEPDRLGVYQEVADLKRAITRDPRNAIAWLELARWYTTLGQPQHPRDAIVVAVALAPANRYILRSAACFYVGVGKPKVGHSLLARSPATPFDPWLLATELATANASGERPTFIKVARSLLDHGSFSPFELSELASEVGTLDLGGGNDRHARKLLRQALVAPTENSLAQVEWASRHTSGLVIPDGSLEMPLANEARALHSQEEGEWLDAFASATYWLEDQTFSSQAAMVASHAASVGLMDWEEGFKKAVLGLEAHRTDAGLLNNAAYPLIELGRYQEADAFLARVDIGRASIDSRICISATEGLLAYRTGSPDRGRRFYLRSIAAAHATAGKQRLEAMAAVMLAREELSVDREAGLLLLQEAEKLVPNARSSAVDRWLKITQELARSSALP